jgi:hypothetical protein
MSAFGQAIRESRTICYVFERRAKKLPLHFRSHGQNENESCMKFRSAVEF